MRAPQKKSLPIPALNFNVVNITANKNLYEIILHDCETLSYSERINMVTIHSSNEELLNSIFLIELNSCFLIQCSSVALCLSVQSAQQFTTNNIV